MPTIKPPSCSLTLSQARHCKCQVRPCNPWLVLLRSPSDQQERALLPPFPRQMFVTSRRSVRSPLCAMPCKKIPRFCIAGEADIDAKDTSLPGAQRSVSLQYACHELMQSIPHHCTQP